MDESERLQRMKEYIYYHGEGDGDLYKQDGEFANRIVALLNHTEIDKYCMVDAYYYDFSVIPRGIQEKLNLCRDCYLIFGITIRGEMITKWVDRWDLDSVHPIIDGKVIHKPYNPCEICEIPAINVKFDPALLSTPAHSLCKLFDMRGNSHVVE